MNANAIQLQRVLGASGTNIGPGGRALLATGEFAQTQAGPFTVGELLPQQARFRIVGEGPPEHRSVVAETRAAARLLEGSTREPTERIVRGLVSLAYDRPGSAIIKGVALSTSRYGFALNRMMTDLVERMPPEVGPAGATPPKDLARELRSRLEDYRTQVDDVWAIYQDGWIDVGPRISRILRNHVRHPDTAEPAARRDHYSAAYVLRHELEHAITPTATGTGEGIGWLHEEGVADALARWPGAVAETARALGLRHLPAKLPAGYPEQRRVIRQWLRYAGIDTRRKEERSRADRLLQADPPDVAIEKLYLAAAGLARA